MMVCFCIFLVGPTVQYDSRYSGLVEVKAGSTLILPINFTGYPTPRVHWYVEMLMLYDVDIMVAGIATQIKWKVERDGIMNE